MSLDSPIFLTVWMVVIALIVAAGVVVVKVIRDRASEKLELIRAEVKQATQVVTEARAETLRYDRLKLYEDNVRSLRQALDALQTGVHQAERACQGLAQESLNKSTLRKIWSRLPVWQWQRLRKIETLAGETAQFEARSLEINQQLTRLRAIPRQVAEAIIRLEGRLGGLVERLADAELLGAEVDEKNNQLDRLDGELRAFSAWAWQTQQVDPLMLSREQIERAPAADRAAQELDAQLTFLETIINRWLADWNKITLLQKEALQNWDAAVALLHSLPPALEVAGLLAEFKTCEQSLKDCPRAASPLHVGALSDLVTGLPGVVREVKGLLKKVRDLQWTFNAFASLVRDNAELLTRIHTRVEEGRRASAYSIAWETALLDELDEIADRHAAVQNLEARRVPEELKVDLQTAQEVRERAEKLEKGVNETHLGRESDLQALTGQIQNNIRCFETIRAEIEQGTQQAAYPIAWAPATLSGLDALGNEQSRLQALQSDHTHQDLRDDIQAAQALYVKLEQFGVSLREAIENSRALLRRYQKLDAQIWENWVSIVNLYSEVKRYEPANWPPKDQVSTLLFDAQKLNNQIQVFTGKHSPKDQPLPETQVLDTLAEIENMAQAWQAVLERRDSIQRTWEEIQGLEKAAVEQINRILDALSSLESQPVLDPLEIQGDALLSELETRAKGLVKEKVARANTWLETCENKLKEVHNGLRPAVQKAYDQLDERITKIQGWAVLSEEPALQHAAALRGQIAKSLQSLRPASAAAPVERVVQVVDGLRAAQGFQEQAAQALRRLDGEIDLPLRADPGGMVGLKEAEGQVRERASALRAKKEKSQHTWPQFACELEKIERETQQASLLRPRLREAKTVSEARKWMGELKALYDSTTAEIALQEKNITAQQAELGQQMAQLKTLETRLRVRQSDAGEGPARQAIDKCLKEIELGTQKVQQSPNLGYAEAKRRLEGLASAAKTLLEGEK